LQQPNRKKNKKPGHVEYGTEIPTAPREGRQDMPGIPLMQNSPGMSFDYLFLFLFYFSLRVYMTSGQTFDGRDILFRRREGSLNVWILLPSIHPSPDASQRMMNITVPSACVNTNLYRGRARPGKLSAMSTYRRVRFRLFLDDSGNTSPTRPHLIDSSLAFLFFPCTILFGPFIFTSSR